MCRPKKQKIYRAKVQVSLRWTRVDGVSDEIDEIDDLCARSGCVLTNYGRHSLTHAYPPRLEHEGVDLG